MKHATRPAVPRPPSLLLCCYRALSVETAVSVFALVRRGWQPRVHAGDALISRVRSVAVSRWFCEADDDVFLMVDDDIVFSPEGAERVVSLAQETRSVACGAYPVRDGSHLACRALPETAGIAFGPDAAPVEVEYAATGFMAVHRDVIAALTQALPLCYEGEPLAFWPLFLPAVVASTNPAVAGLEYLGEDWAFCARAQAAGFRVWMAPDVKLTHLGTAPFTVDVQRARGDVPPDLGPIGARRGAERTQAAAACETW